MKRHVRRQVIEAWKVRRNTMEIARHLDLGEPEVDQVIYWWLTTRWKKTQETWKNAQC